MSTQIPVNNTTYKTQDYKPFPMVIPSSWDPLTKRYHKDKLALLKDLVTEATERGLLQQLVKGSTTQDQVLVDPYTETAQDGLVRKEKHDLILSINASQAKAQDAAEGTQISKKKADAAQKKLAEQFKPLQGFPQNLNDFIGEENLEFNAYPKDQMSQQFFDTMYDVLRKFKIPSQQVDTLRTLTENAPHMLPDGKQKLSLNRIIKKLETLQTSAATLAQKKPGNLPEITEAEATLRAIISHVENILFLAERNAALTEFQTGSPATQGAKTIAMESNLSPSGATLNEQGEEAQQSMSPPPPPPLPNPQAKASATSIADTGRVEDPETRKMISVGTPRYLALQRRYKTLDDGTFVAPMEEVATNVAKDRAVAKAMKARSLHNNALSEAVKNPKLKSVGKITQIAKQVVKSEDDDNPEGQGLPENMEVVVRPKITRGRNMKIVDNKFGSLEVAKKMFDTGVLKVCKNRKVIIHKELTPGLKHLLTKRYSRMIDYTQDDLDTFAYMCKEGGKQMPKLSKKAQIVAGSIKPKEVKTEKEVKIIHYQHPQELADRLHILMGSMDAGNKSKSMKEEASNLVDLLKKHGMVSGTGAESLMDEILK